MAMMLRSMTTGELLDRTFFLYRTHFLLFVGIVALPYLAVLALQLAGFAIQTTFVSTIANSVLTGILYLLAMAASQAATVVTVSDVHLERPASIAGAYAKVKNLIPRVLFIMIAVWLGIAMGLLLLIVPGVIFALMWSLAIPVAVLENKGLSEAATRSRNLTKGSRGRIFVIYFLFIVLLYIITLAWEVPMLAVLGSTLYANKQVAPAWFSVVVTVMAFITTSLVAPLLTIALSLVYYDQRVRKEAFDLQLMMSSLETRPANSVAAGAP